MGLWFLITFENCKSGETKRFEFFTLLDAKSAWLEVVTYAHGEWDKLFAEDKYWVLKEIRDNVRR